MKKFLLNVLCLLVVLFFLNSCIITVIDSSGASAGRWSEEFHKVIPLDSEGTLSLENIYGDIEIHGWDKEEVEIYAEKKILLPSGKKVRWYSTGYPVPKIDVDEFEDYIKIKTKPPRRDMEETVVNYYLSVPHSIDLKDIVTREGEVVIADFYGEAVIDLRKGDIEVENFSGSLNASVVTGSVKAILYDLRSSDEIRITTKEGDISIYLQSDINAQIDASTPNGYISSEFEFKEPLPATKISEQIGKGGTVISLSSLNGDIRIKKF